MKLADAFIGKEARALNAYINSLRVAAITEINSNSEAQRKLDELRKNISKQSANYIIIAFKY